MFFCRLLVYSTFFNFQKNLAGINISMSNSLDPIYILSGLIWVLTVCKGYQQTTLAVKQVKGIFTSVDSGESVQPPFKLRNSKF